MNSIEQNENLKVEAINDIVQSEAANVKDIKITRKGICFIFSTKNNTIIMITDLTGAETFAKFSGGMKVKSKKDEGSAYAAIQAAQDAADKAKELGIDVCDIKVRARGGIKRRNLGPGAQSALRTFISSGIKVGRIYCVTPVPHGGCRAKGGHKGRRV